jgi:hypothetical protein
MQVRLYSRIYERETPVAWKEKAMGEIIWQEGPSGLALSTYIGPAQPAGGVLRTGVQVMTVGGQFLQLNLIEWADLCSAVRQLAGEFPRPHSVALPR